MTEVTEKEWSDRFGEHYEVRGKDKTGRVHSLKLTKNPLLGWPSEREHAKAFLEAKITEANHDHGLH